jgi:adenylate cyclase
MVLFMTVTTFLFNSFILDLPVFSNEVIQTSIIFVGDFAFWSVILFISFIVFSSLFYTEVSDSLGQNALENFFLGKYHSPQEEERIFMFLDMKNSTTIAEKLGHDSYFSLLNAYYFDMTRAIMSTYGRIYQYVGDEVVITWTLKNGIQNNNCIKCFFDIRDALQFKHEEYHSKFGHLPEFKAGVHFGSVTTGEIGFVKKDIIFTGDVLNTTSRIQELCKGLKKDLLVSNTLLNKMNLTNDYKAEYLGTSSLRGREAEIQLYSIEKMEVLSKN